MQAERAQSGAPEASGTPEASGAAETAADQEALLDALVQTSFTVMAVLTRIAAENDMSLTQLRVLGILRGRRPRMAELAEFLGLDRSTMSGLVDRAESRGLLERGRNAQDGRAIDVFMTAAGRALADRVNAEVRRALAPVTGRLDARQRRSLGDVLEQMLRPFGDEPASGGRTPRASAPAPAARVGEAGRAPSVTSSRSHSPRP